MKGTMGAAMAWAKASLDACRRSPTSWKASDMPLASVPRWTLMRSLPDRAPRSVKCSRASGWLRRVGEGGGGGANQGINDHAHALPLQWWRCQG
jgi:hypothetical protein